MEGPGVSDNADSYGGRRTIRNLKAVVLALVVALIILSSAVAYLYLQSNASPPSGLSQPRFVHLIDPQQLSSVVGGNWAKPSPSLPVLFFNASNPTGLLETELLVQSSFPSDGMTVSVTVSGFNASSDARFAYENYQLDYVSLMNYTTSGLIAPAENYTLWGSCNQAGLCSSLSGFAIWSVYVVRVSLSTMVLPQRIPPVVNDSVVESLLRAQLSEIIPWTSSGLTLSLSLNATSIKVGEDVSYTASLLNTGATKNNLSSADNWLVPDLVITPCGPQDSPIAVAVVQGSYTPSNVTEAPRIDYGSLCTTLMGGVRSYVFQPASGVASVFGSCNPNPCFTKSILTSGIIDGYWSKGDWVILTPGVYTVVAADEWGDVMTSSFTVLA